MEKTSECGHRTSVRVRFTIFCSSISHFFLGYSAGAATVVEMVSYVEVGGDRTMGSSALEEHDLILKEKSLRPNGLCDYAQQRISLTPKYFAISFSHTT
jgi:hypothetical protein